ncbi:MAG TPA: tyrosine--tRNA ligase [Cytophagales bacterium]|jgi:tyrosyl-tRNA synthetase|nr:tyrosine--tRNA ligase [Cytophagales bacterium]
MNFIEELRWRGMIHDMMPGTEEQLNKEMTSAYIGFDPTASSLHIGNLAQIMLLRLFQASGHKPYALVGGATGMVGDPSGKSEERNLLDEDTLRHNQECIKLQLEKFLDFDTGDNKAVLVNNYDWFKEISFLEFLRDAGKHISVNYMMAKDSVKKRLETGISFTEFSYQLLQGYDFYYLFKNNGVKLQMGGSDQWGNITTGTEFIRRKANGDAFALTSPLITKADGSKFGKSEEGNVWLDPKMTSPYKFYQFWLNVSDEEASTLIRKFTLKTREEIEALEKEHVEVPHMRALQKALAEDITISVHSKEALENAQKASNILFGKSTTEELAGIDEATLLSVFEGVPKADITKSELDDCDSVVTLLSETSGGIIFRSKGEARRMIKGGGVSVNKEKVNDMDQKPAYDLLQEKYLLVQRGKKNYFLIEVK